MEPLRLNVISGQPSRAPRSTGAEQPAGGSSTSLDLPLDLMDQIALASRDEPEPAPSPEAEPHSEQKLTRALARIQASGCGVMGDRQRVLADAFASGDEALVRVDRGYSVAVPFRNLDELQDYADMVSGASPSDSKLQQGFEATSELEHKGSQFFFGERGDKVLGFLPLHARDTWFRTDAAGAALLLRRGAKVRVVTGSGDLRETSSLKGAGKLASITPEPPAERVALTHKIDSLNGHGLYFSPNIEFPDDILVTDYGKEYRRELKMQIGSAFGEKLPSSSVLQQKKLVDDLAAGRDVQMFFDGDYPTYPTMVNKQELAEVERFRSRPTLEMKRIAGAVGRLGERKCPVFARPRSGDYKGGMLAARPEVVYLSLKQGREASFLTPAGDLITANSPDEFLDSVYANLGQGTDRAFAERFRAAEKHGASFWATPDEKKLLDPVEAEGILRSGGSIYTASADGKPSGLDTKGFIAMAPSQPGQSPAEPARVDPAAPKPNLLMVYHQPLHDPTGMFSYYDDGIQKLKQAGSNDQVDMVVEHADLFGKRNLRRDYVQKGELEPLERLDPHQAMSDAKVFEDFVYNTVREFPDRDHVRLMVFGHGGGEQGLLDDLKQPAGEQPYLQNMGVEDFADCIHRGLDRVEQDTGRRPGIDNLVLGSCLMGNTSLIDALARRGDVRVVSASPENLLDELLQPQTLEYLKDPATSHASPEQFGRKLVDTQMQATGFRDGKPNRRHALIYGSYDLDPAKNERFRTALGKFFGACLEHPDQAALLREDIARCPTYNIHPAGGPGIGENQRDLIQVAERIGHDARLHDPTLKEAARELIEAHAAQVIDQQTTPGYQGRGGASIFLPLDPQDYPFHGRPATGLLRDVPYADLLKMIMNAPDRPAAHELAAELLYRQQGQQQVDASEQIKPLTAENLAVSEQRALDSSAAPKAPNPASRLLTAAARVAGAAGAGLVGGVIGLVTGAAAGGLAGVRGHSLVSSYRPDAARVEQAFAPDQPAPQPIAPVTSEPERQAAPATLSAAMARHGRIADATLAAPAEYVGTELHRSIAYSTGSSLLAALAAAPLGAISGAVAGLLEGLGVGATAGWQLPDGGDA